MPEGSPARGVAAGLLLAALAAGVVWTLWPTRDGAGTPTPASAPASASVEPAPSAPPEAPLEQPEQPAGPATGDYAELATAAELEHPDTDPHIRRWYDRFRPHVRGGRGHWANKPALWDSLAPEIRAEARELGSPFDSPLFDGDTPQPAAADVQWSDATTGGRGDVVAFTVTYMAGGRVLERAWTVLIVTHADGKGEVSHVMDPFDLAVTDYTSFASFRKAAADRQWTWVEQQKPEK